VRFTVFSYARLPYAAYSACRACTCQFFSSDNTLFFRDAGISRPKQINAAKKRSVPYPQAIFVPVWNSVSKVANFLHDNAHFTTMFHHLLYECCLQKQVNNYR